MEYLHPKAVHWFFLENSGALLGAIIPVFLIAIFISETGILESLIWKIFILSMVGLLSGYIIIKLLYWWANLLYKNYLYELTKETIKIERGVIWKKYISIPYERIQNVDIYRGIIARVLDLSDIYIQTAGYSGYIQTEGRLPGLSREDAEKIREDLIQRAKGTKQGL